MKVHLIFGALGCVRMAAILDSIFPPYAHGPRALPKSKFFIRAYITTIKKETLGTQNVSWAYCQVLDY